MSDNIDKGRAALQAWEASKPDNFFTADRNLQSVLRRYMGDEAYAAAEPNFKALGAACATVIDRNAKIEDRIGNHPRLDRWNGIGERTEQIEFHPSHDANGQIVWSSGIMAMQGEAGRTVEQMGLFYLLNHNGEAGHMCSLACTSGLIRALKTVADDAVREKFLPPLLNSDYEAMQHGAQFLTEVQGGSDVGANAVMARPHEDGTWRITGEKWFCSNINADQFLMTARPEGAPDGTPGLGLFVVPRRLDDGSTNGFYIRRLKDKLGTRTLASAEVDFVDAVAYPVGALDSGFKNVVSLVLNTSRLMNAVACAGIMRRAYIEAASYACAREAFGQPIANYPLVQETVADMMSEYYAATASSFAVAHLLDLVETGAGDEYTALAYRMFVNINKYITSIRGSEVVHQSIEVLGGNGAIESFSILPRLYRDMVVLESWEGTHNVLCLQVLRDIMRYHVHEPFVAYIRQQLETVQTPVLDDNRQLVEVALDETLSLMQRMVANGERYAQAHARRLVDRFAHIAQAALLLAEAEAEQGQPSAAIKQDVITHFINRRIRTTYDPLADGEYLARIERLMMAF